MSALFFDKEVTFASLPLDRRLFKAIARQRLVYPSVVQSRTLPLALQGKDLLISARTGSGKTLAYLLPLLQHLLTAKDASPSPTPCTSSLILVPTRELAHQVKAALTGLLFYCADLVTAVVLTADARPQTQIALLRQRPDVLIATPGRLREHIDGGAVDASTVRVLVLDEADLLLTFDYDADVRAIHARLPSRHQTLLLSATLSPSLTALSSLLLTQPTSVTLDSSPASPSTLRQFYIRTPSHDKLLLLYAFLRLRVVDGRCLFFVRDVDAAFRLKLLLEQFSISSAVINEQLPFASRMNVLQQFNRGMFDYLIATDRSVKKEEEQRQQQQQDGQTGKVEGKEGGHALVKVEESEEAKVKDEMGEEQVEESADGKSDEDDEVEEVDGPMRQPDHDDGAEAGGRRQRTAGRGVRREFDVTRGIDFVDVATVVNVDFPSSVSAYIHRVGRTARAGRSGTAISFVTDADVADLDAVLAHQTEQLAQTTLNPSPPLVPLSFDASAMEAFRYRVEDVSRAVTAARVQSARLQEQRQALLTSTKLRAYYEDHPAELGVLRADRGVKGARVQPHLADVPSYLLPRGVQQQDLGGGRKGRMGRSQGDKAKPHKARRTPFAKRSRDDPLRSAGRGQAEGEAAGSRKRRRRPTDI